MPRASPKLTGESNSISARVNASVSETGRVRTTVVSSIVPTRSMRRRAMPQIQMIFPGVSFATTGSELEKLYSEPSALIARSARAASSRLTGTVSGCHCTSNRVGLVSRTDCR